MRILALFYTVGFLLNNYVCTKFSRTETEHKILIQLLTKLELQGIILELELSELQISM